MRVGLVIGTVAVILSTAVAVSAFDPPPGYLAGQPPLDYKAVLGTPPAPESPEGKAERAAYAASAAGIGGKAWQAAITQLHPGSAEVNAQVSCAVGRSLTAETTPVTMVMLGRIGRDMGGPIEATKLLYRRDRPYVGQADARTCDPRSLKTGGALSYAYPSGHAAFGALAARVLADAAPDRATVLTAWGNGVGDNRVACRVHWPSDVAAGRKLADALYARIAETPDYRADVAIARSEIAKAPPATGCTAG